MKSIPALAFGTILVAGCAAEGNTGGTAVSTIADTTVVTSSGSRPTYSADSISVVLQSPELELPDRLMLIGDRLVIGDRRRLHFLDLSSGSVRSTGRPGDGPGEFRAVSALGASGADILVFDVALDRLTVLDSSGKLVRTHRLSPSIPHFDVRRWNNVVHVAGQGVIMLLSTGMDNRKECSTNAALVWHDLAADTATVLRVWCDMRWMNVENRYVSPRFLFPEKMAFATSADGRVASGDGMGYCILVEYTSAEPNRRGPMKICRDWEPIALGPGIRRQDFSDLPVDEDTKRTLRNVLDQQRLPDHLPAYDRIQFDTSNRLWVRTLGPEFADLHPIMMDWLPERGPPRRSWDVFAVTGAMLGTVNLPAQFDPAVITEERAYGLYELATGEVVIGKIEVPRLKPDR